MTWKIHSSLGLQTEHLSPSVGSLWRNVQFHHTRNRHWYFLGIAESGEYAELLCHLAWLQHCLPSSRVGWHLLYCEVDSSVVLLRKSCNKLIRENRSSHSLCFTTTSCIGVGSMEQLPLVLSIVINTLAILLLALVEDAALHRLDARRRETALQGSN